MFSNYYFKYLLKVSTLIPFKVVNKTQIRFKFKLHSSLISTFHHYVLSGFPILRIKKSKIHFEKWPPECTNNTNFSSVCRLKKTHTSR